MNSDASEVLELLRYRFVEGPSAGAKPAQERFRYARGNRRREIALAALLRDHRERMIEARGEIDLRDAFDELLAYYSLIEIAMRAGVVSRLPEPLTKEVRSLLQHSSVRPFYESYYPLVLPQLLLRRLMQKTGAPGSAENDRLPVFYKFLDVSTLIDDGTLAEDGDAETFFWLLDDGKTADGYSVEDFLEVTKRPRDLFVRMQRQDDDQDWLDVSLHGFKKFLTFCVSFDAFLARVQEPSLQSAYWHYHGYWFGQLQAELGTSVLMALNNFTAWKPGEQATVRSVSQTQRAIAQLTSGRFSWVLWEELLRPTHAEEDVHVEQAISRSAYRGSVASSLKKA
jgi:hypothetical protein